MSRYLGPKCRLCRREGKKLFLKGERCNSPKCPLEKKGAVPPGVHRTKSYVSKQSEFGKQLREKQKVKRIYGVSERQMKKYFKEARKEKAATGKALLRLLESRLDNVIYRLGFASSRAEARQLIKHGFFQVEGRKVDIPSFLVKKGDVISLTKKTQIEKAFEPPSWLERKGGAARVINLPKDDQLPSDIDDYLIVEFYSRV